ncbi:hypothetical protein KIW84_055421 [Lathyrus oleraceus]|uniref:Uncharacterized protein n=1 Tax=Pisum sativum TaxID=3888 RepID=A0A9D4X0I6_PEA|nr:hypothetical protein KIW84_055421 [Pisum sativum]
MLNEVIDDESEAPAYTNPAQFAKSMEPSSFEYGSKWHQLCLTVKVENAIGVEKEKKPSISSYKQAVEVVRNGGIPGWGKIIGIMVKADMFGIGYQPDQDSSEQNRGRRPLFTFISAGMLDSSHTGVVGKEIDSDCEIDQWIRSCVPGNWKV